MEKRENLASRLGFLFLSAGCAIGLGNVWRFPFITGKYGGAVFIAAYLIFLVAMALPVLIMEFAVGRASRRNMGNALKMLEPAGTGWRECEFRTACRRASRGFRQRRSAGGRGISEKIRETGLRTGRFVLSGAGAESGRVFRVRQWGRFLVPLL